MSDLTLGAGNPYADLPKAKVATENTAAAQAARKRKAEENPDGLPDGWRKVESRSKKGHFSYENKHTKERIGWVPDRPASKKPKMLPPAPKREKKPKPAPLAPEEKKAKDTATLLDAFGKITKLMAKDEKFGPLCKSFHKSLYSSSAFDGGEATITAIYNVLQATQANPGRVIEKGNAKYVRAVFKRIQEKIDLFPKSDHFQLKTWFLRSIYHVELTYTDDTYQYNKCTKEFVEALLEVERMSKKQIVELAGIDSEHAAPPPAVDAPLIRERMEVIVEVMATLLSRARLQWTMPTVKSVFKNITDRRHLFDTDLHEQIDHVFDSLHKKQYAVATRVTSEKGLDMGARTFARQGSGAWA